MIDDDLRDDLGDEISAALRLRSRVDPHESTTFTIPRRPRRVRVHRALAATAFAALATVGVGAIIASRPGPGHLRVATSPTTTPTPRTWPSTGVQDWTWVSDDHGWALVRTPCGTSICVIVRETVDGGRTWTSLPTPDAVLWGVPDTSDGACSSRACLSGVRFATAKIGWLFGPDLFETSDGGRTWARVASTTVADVEAANGVAMRLTTADHDCGGACEYRIDSRRIDASQSWQRVPSGPEYSFPRLLLQEGDAYDVNTANPAGAGEAFLRHSSDAGTTWTQIADPCPAARAGTRTSSGSAAPGGVFVVLCRQAGGSSAFVRISNDRGVTFGPPRAVPDPPLNSGPIAAASADIIAVAYSDDETYGVLVTDDGGRTWRPTLSLPTTRTGPNGIGSSVGWQDARTARASFNTDAIWTTRDGGQTWTQDRVAP